MMNRFALVLLVVLVSTTTNAFTTSHHRQQVRSPSSLFLKPSQGPQLVAAWESSTCPHPKHYDDLEKEGEEEDAHKSAAREFVARLFSLPASLLHPRKEEHHDEEDLVKFPVVGFRYSPGSKQPIATSGSCRIPLHLHNEEVFGWYSKACFLQPFDSDSYAKNPNMSKKNDK
eukprot:CAMPEP_0194033414 /NCGR_PEP_ID=MMETSP0009_2-20130614/6122_1 /TAXON_ID=210454 /ORGANISM="Grammatophora oceanica, Strain CCMP 410" /LENGTH=171 /DNA_ID=CAMNT_0038674107 /DNA_START=122 /DNA_END=637 /DNA_ORIENTATION=+